MQTRQHTWSPARGWNGAEPGGLDGAQLVLLFGGTSVLKAGSGLDELRAAYPDAHLIGCSTAGEIHDVFVEDDTLVATAVRFEHSRAVGQRVRIEPGECSLDVGRRLAERFEPRGLRHLFVLSDGLNVNGSDLVRGITSLLPQGVTVTGGLSGDGDRFGETVVVSDDRRGSDMVAALGLYGDRLRVGYASLGGWDTFGPERAITRSEGNVLYELDGRSALALYKEYLGEHAEGLPATGLLFPLALRAAEGDTPVVRTILATDEEEQSLTFAGDVPQGSYARLMKANFDRLVDGAAGAARSTFEAIGASEPELAILISCVGRKMVLKQRVEEEVEAVREVLGPGTMLTGFYSYGEISPFTTDVRCELHNQTMTITALSEA